VMIHQGSSGFEGTPADIAIRANEILSLTQRVAEIIAQHADRSVESVKRDMDRDRFMTAQEAHEYGLIDDVIEPRKLRPLRPYLPSIEGQSGNGDGHGVIDPGA
jgi:ATP-dependent Clp protease protease subunit